MQTHASRAPTLVSNVSPLALLAAGVWVESSPVRFLGLRLTSTMTVLRLGDGTLLVHSPVPLTDERRRAVEALGSVRHLYAPNLFHHLALAEWARAFPEARLHAPAGLSKKRPELLIDRALQSGPDPSLAGTLDEIFIEGFRLEEGALFHRPSRTLIVADLVHNIGTPEGAWTRLYTRAMGFYDRIALSRMIRWTGVADRKAMQHSVERLLSLPFERAIVGHGAPIEAANQPLRDACAWLG